MQTSPRIVGPDLDAKDQCEAILRSVPQWFGIEEALVRYVSDTTALPTFAVQGGEQLEAFLTLREHFLWVESGSTWTSRREADSCENRLLLVISEILSTGRCSTAAFNETVTMSTI
jgi:hypothetical protein